MALTNGRRGRRVPRCRLSFAVSRFRNLVAIRCWNPPSEPVRGSGDTAPRGGATTRRCRRPDRSPRDRRMPTTSDRLNSQRSRLPVAPAPTGVLSPNQVQLTTSSGHTRPARVDRSTGESGPAGGPDAGDEPASGEFGPHEGPDAEDCRAVEGRTNPGPHARITRKPSGA